MLDVDASLLCITKETTISGKDTPLIGESLLTLFASLTYAYHCLMTIIK